MPLTMKRVITWLAVGLVIFVFGTVVYSGMVEVGDTTRFIATMLFRGYVYVTLIAVAIGVGRWMFSPSK